MVCYQRRLRPAFIACILGFLLAQACAAGPAQPTPTFELGARRPRPPGTATLLDFGHYRIDIPVYPGAQDVRREVLSDWGVRESSFRTTNSADQVHAFYEQMLLAQGWEFVLNEPNNITLAYGNSPDESAFSLNVQTEERDGQTYVELYEIASGPFGVFYPTQTPSPSAARTVIPPTREE